MPQWLTGSGALPFRRAEGKSASWYVLKQRRFLVYFGGSLVSNLGTWLQNTAQMLLAYQLTHSAFAVGLITCAQFSGFLVVGPWAGALADRLGGRRVLIGAQFVSAAVAGTLAYMQFNGMLTERPLVLLQRRTHTSPRTLRRRPGQHWRWVGVHTQRDLFRSLRRHDHYRPPQRLNQVG